MVSVAGALITSQDGLSSVNETKCFGVRGRKIINSQSACNKSAIVQNIPDTLREKAMRLVEGITEEKITKSSVQALGLAADRFLNRAEAIEGRWGSLAPLVDVFQRYGIQPSHSVSRLTVKQEITVEKGSSE